MDSTLLIAIFSGIAVLLVLILKFRIQAFIALLISSIVVGIIAGMDPEAIVKTIQTGMGNTLGFLVLILGLGAMLGKLVADSGAAQRITSS